jgi:hypothetical protein
MFRTHRWFVIVACAFALSGLSARADDPIRSYTVPKELPAAPAGASLPAQSEMAQAASDIPVNTAPVRWTLPEGWQQLPPDGIRLANFAVPGKEGAAAAVAVTSFPGEMGTDWANVNRWRQQLGLAPVEEGDISSAPVTVDSSDGKLFDLSGSTARMIVASVRRSGATWFFKMTGDPAAVGEAKPAFMEFLKSIRFSGGNDSEPATTTTAGDGSSPKWSVPSNWVEKTPGPMLFESFSIADNAGANAAVTVSFFQGAVGGVLANVNRWRGQIGLAPVEQDQLAGISSALDTAGGAATLVDFEGADARPGQRLVAVILPHGENTWFYKLLGDKALVATEKDSFVNFVKNAQYP